MSTKKHDADTADSVWQRLAGQSRTKSGKQNTVAIPDVADSGLPASAAPQDEAYSSLKAAEWAELAAGIPAPAQESETPTLSGDHIPAMAPAGPDDEDTIVRAEADSDGEASDTDDTNMPDTLEAGPGKRTGKDRTVREAVVLGPILPAVAMSRDEDGNPVPTPGNGFTAIYRIFAYAPIILTLALLAVQVAFTLDTRELWYSDEVRHANALQNMLENQNWLTLEMDGQQYPDKPPVYFWFLAAMHTFLHIPVGPMLFFLGAAVSGSVLLLSTHMLARLVGRVDGRTSLAAGIILLTGFFVSGLLHYSRMDLLFAACITFSHIALYQALIRRKAAALMILAFLLAGLATLIKGPFGLAFPLAAALGYCLWQGRPGRLFRLDMLLGLLAGALLPALWLGAAWMEVGPEFLDNIFGQQIARRALNTWHHGQNWFYYLYMLPLIFLPWSLLIPFLPWTRALGRDARQALRESRGPERGGLAYLWSMVITGLLLASLVSIKLPIYLLPLFPALCVLAGRAALRLSPGRSRAFATCMGLVFLLLGLAFLLVPYLTGIEVAPTNFLAKPLAELTAIPAMPQGRLILAAICLVAGCALLFFPGRSRPEAALLLLSLFSAGFAYPLWSISAPSLDSFMSPRVQAEVVKDLKAQGYAVYSIQVYPGTYAYYAGTVPRLKNWDQALEQAGKTPRLAVALRASAWDNLVDKGGFREVNRQVIAERAYVVVARDQAEVGALPGTKTPEPADRLPEGEEPAQSLPDNDTSAQPIPPASPEPAPGESPSPEGEDAASVPSDAAPNQGSVSLQPGEAAPDIVNEQPLVPVEGIPDLSGDSGAGTGSTEDIPAEGRPLQ